MMCLWERFGCLGRVGLQLLSDAFYIHALQDVRAECREEGHDSEGDVLLVLLEPSPETDKRIGKTP